MTLSDYLVYFRHEISRIDTFGFAESIAIHEELRAGKQAIIKAKIVLVDGSCLLIREYLDTKYGIEKMSYAYHYQDRGENLIFRYDNAAHKPALTSPEHKHLFGGGIELADPPEISDLIEEVIQLI